MTDDAAAADSGIPHAEALLAFAEAAVGRDDEALARTRARVLEELGPEELVDAAAVVGNFERMVRIADGTGIPLDPPMEVLTQDVRGELGIDRFGSAANTPEAGPVQRAVGSALRPVALGVIKLWGVARRQRAAR